jgi:hypothetical protein
MLTAPAPVVMVMVMTMSSADAVGIEIAGVSDCPTPDDVRARVAALSPASAEARGVVEIASGANELQLRLRQADGAVAAERRLPSDGLACADLAAAAAAVIATWTSDVHPDLAPARPVAAATATPRHPPAAAGTSLAAAVGLAGSAAPAAGERGWALGVEVAGHLRGPGRRLGARLAVTGQTERSLSLGSGRAWTRRWAAAVGPTYALDGGGPVRVEVGAGAAGSWFTVRGTGFPRNLSGGELDFGGAAHLTLSMRRPWLAPFAALEVMAWPRRRTAVDLQTGASRALPRAEVALVLGLLAGSP